MPTPQLRRIYQLPSLTTPATQLAGAYLAWEVPLGPGPGGYKTYRGTPEELAAYLKGQGLAGSETAALISADPATGTLTYEAPRGLSGASVTALGLAITTSAGTTHTLLANLTSVYDSGTGELTIELPAGTDLADVVSVHLYRPTPNGEEQMLAADLYPFAYTNSELDARFAVKQGAVTRITRAYAYAPTLTLSRIHLSTVCLLATGGDTIIDLPVPTLAEVGTLLTVDHYSGSGAEAFVTWRVSLPGSATYATPPPPQVLAVAPRKYVTEFKAVRFERGTPYDDVVATWVATANSQAVPDPKADLVGGTVPTTQLPGFRTAIYTVQPADVALPAKSLVIAVANALLFVNVQVIGTPQLVYGSHYTSLPGQLLVDASVVGSLQTGDRIRYSYQVGGANAPGGPGYSAGTGVEISPTNELSSTTLDLASSPTGNYTLQASDAGKLIPMMNSAPVTVVVPAHADVPYRVGTIIYVEQSGTGDVTVLEGPGVVFRIAQGYGKKVAGALLRITLHKRDSNTWLVEGGVT